MELREETRMFRVVKNHEEQCSIWPEDRELPAGWQAGGKRGTREECLTFIEQTWVDMRPLSVRQWLEQLAQNGVAAEEQETAPLATEEPLVVRLSAGDHPVEVAARPEHTAAALHSMIQNGLVFLRFPNTRGGTELGIRVDADALDLSAVDFDRGTGRLHVVGELVLDGVPARCIAEVDLSTLAGVGHLEPV